MASSNKKSGGKKGQRTISKVKRNNQRMNKLVKRGKVKLKSSSSPYLKKQAEQAQNKKLAKERNKRNPQNLKNQKPKLENEENESDVEIDEEDAEMLKKWSNAVNGGSQGEESESSDESSGSDDEGDHEAEQRALQRYARNNEDGEKKVLLPVKDAKGNIHMKTERIQVEEDEEDSANEDDQVSEDEGMQVDDSDSDEGEVPQEPKSVLSILDERKKALERLKIDVGGIASSFMENPQERIGLLEKLVEMMDDRKVLIPAVRNTGFKLLVATIAELLKDVIPGYKITGHHDGAAEGAPKQKKETFKLVTFEKTLLEQAKGFLMKLEAAITQEDKEKIGEKTSNGAFALKTMCDILLAAPHFNFAENIVRFVTPMLNHKAESIRLIADECFGRVLNGDKKGEISLVIVKAVKKYIVAKKFQCKPAMLRPFLRCHLHYGAKGEVQEEKGGKKRKHELSKKEKKQAKQMEKLERELREAKAEESKQVREKLFTEVSKAVFEVLFKIAKNYSRSNLLKPALSCISKFSDCLNLEFFNDLLRVISELITDDELRRDVRLQAMKTALDIYSGTGDCLLSFDPSIYVRTLVEFLPYFDLSREDEDIANITAIIESIVKRRKTVSKDLVAFLAKAVASATLQMAEKQQAHCLTSLRSIKSHHIGVFTNLLESEGYIPQSIGPIGASADSQASVRNSCLWELNLLASHYDPTVKQKFWPLTKNLTS